MAKKPALSYINESERALELKKRLQGMKVDHKKSMDKLDVQVAAMQDGNRSVRVQQDAVKVNAEIKQVKPPIEQEKAVYEGLGTKSPYL